MAVPSKKIPCAFCGIFTIPGVASRMWPRASVWRGVTPCPCMCLCQPHPTPCVRAELARVDYIGLQWFQPHCLVWLISWCGKAHHISVALSFTRERKEGKKASEVLSFLFSTNTLSFSCCAPHSSLLTSYRHIFGTAQSKRSNMFLIFNFNVVKSLMYWLSAA